MWVVILGSLGLTMVLGSLGFCDLVDMLAH